MNIFPCEEFTIETKRTKEEVIKKLYEMTISSEDFMKFRLSNSGKHFRGDIYGNSFNLKPISFTFSKRSVKPNIIGEVTTDGKSTIIKGVIEVNKLTRIFHPIICIIFILLCLLFGMPLSAIPIVLLAAFINYVIIGISVRNHVINSIKILKQL